MMRSLALAGIIAVGATANAQSPLADSVMTLNRSGLWEQAGLLAQRGIQQTKNETERCALLAGGAYALAQLTRLETAKSTLRFFDRDCAKSPIVQQYAA